MWPEANTTCIGINFGIVKSEEINLTEGYYIADLRLSVGAVIWILLSGSNSGLFDPVETFVFVPADTFADICCSSQFTNMQAPHSVLFVIAGFNENREE